MGKGRRGASWQRLWGRPGNRASGAWALSPRGRLIGARRHRSLIPAKDGRKAMAVGKSWPAGATRDWPGVRHERANTRHAKTAEAQAAQTSPEGRRCWPSRGRRGHRPVGAHRPLASGNDVSQVPRYALWRLRHVQQVTWRTSPTRRFWCRYSARAKWSPPFRVFDAVSAGTVEMGNTASN